MKIRMHILATTAGLFAISPALAEDLSGFPSPKFNNVLTNTLTVQTDNVNALSFMTESEVISGADVSSKMQNALNEARAKRKALYIPNVGPCYLINFTLDPTDVEVFGNQSCLKTTSGNDTFRTTGNSAYIHHLKLEHTGASGSVINLAKGISHQIRNNNITADNSTNSDAIVKIAGSFTFTNDNYFTGFRPNAYIWRQERNVADLISISNAFVGNYMGGTSKGLWIGDNDQYPRPEGTLVANNESIVTGGPFITVKSILSLRLSGNMMDQNNAEGAVRFTPSGFENYGVDGVQITGNYLSAIGGNVSAPAIQNIPGSAGVGGVTVVGNQIVYGSMAALVRPGMNRMIFSGNYMAGFSGTQCITLENESLNSQVDMGTTSQCVNKPLGYINNKPQAGKQRGTVTAKYDTNASGATGYMNVNHGLITSPKTCTAVAQREAGDSANATGWLVTPVTFSDTNITLSVSAQGLASSGTVTIVMTCETLTP